MADRWLDAQQTRYGQEKKVALLKKSETYPERPERIDVVQTHMSWVFLTERYAYKLKKPVRYDFLDFSTLEARQKDCEEEVRLNRRLAGAVYIGTVPLTVASQGKAYLGGRGAIIEWLVKMRRLPAERMLDVMITQGTIREAEVAEVARVLAIFFKENPPMELDGSRYRAQFERDIGAIHRVLVDPVYGLPAALVEATQNAQLALLRREPGLFDQRAVEGRIIEGHGDLRPEHICLEHKPVIFDCLEFNRQFRIVDAADELAFLSLECERLGAAFADRVLWRTYEQITNDRPPRRLVDFYKTYRACLRAKLAVWHTHELAEADWPKWLNRARAYLRLAEKYSPR